MVTIQDQIIEFIEDSIAEGYIPGYMEEIDVLVDGTIQTVVISEHMTYNQYMEVVGV